MKYIIDTDPGIDDAIAISMAYLSNMDIIGFTLVGGNNSLNKIERNIKIIEDYLNSDIKIYRGSENKVITSKEAMLVHGEDGLGDFNGVESSRTTETISATDFLIEASLKYNENLTIICLGPLTNIALAIKKDPSFVQRVKRIYIMGSSLSDDYLEFNVLVDPKSANLVLNANFNEVKVISHEMALKTVIKREDMYSLKNNGKKISDFIYQISKKYMDFNIQKYGIDGISMPDPLTVASAIRPDLVKWEKADVKILSNGKSVVTLGKGNIDFGVSVNLGEFERLFKHIFN